MGTGNTWTKKQRFLKKVMDRNVRTVDFDWAHAMDHLRKQLVPQRTDEELFHLDHATDLITHTWTVNTSNGVPLLTFIKGENQGRESHHNADG